MRHSQFYIGGQWVDPIGTDKGVVVNPATEDVIATIAYGNAEDVDRAARAAAAAFETFSVTTKAERIALLERIVTVMKRRQQDIAEAITAEMGAPVSLSFSSQAQAGTDHFEVTLEALRSFEFDEIKGKTLVTREAIGAVGMITPWNWPMNQIACKVAPALAAGCTVVLKPSELSPLDALLFAEVMDEAGVPPGVFNLVNGTGLGVGAAIAGHPLLSMVTFTGSTRSGIEVARTAALTVKRVTQELGGKSANVLLPDADFSVAVAKGVHGCMGNSGQTCTAPTRMLVPHDRMDEAAAIAKATAASIVTGDPLDPATDLGPVVSKAQYEKIQGLIAKGIEEGAHLAAGGLGRPANLNRGYFVQPTVFSHVDQSMTIARQEIFGPVLSIIGYSDVDDAVTIANDSEYGLAAYVQSADLDAARKVARRIRSGSVRVNYPAFDYFAPFGGYKQSGNGREYAEYGIHEFLEIKAIKGWMAP